MGLPFFGYYTGIPYLAQFNSANNFNLVYSNPFFTTNNRNAPCKYDGVTPTTSNPNTINYSIDVYAASRPANQIRYYQGNPINVEPQTLSYNDILNRYGNSRVLQTAQRMSHLSEANGGDHIITGNKSYQPWCADMVNYYYRQYRGSSPMAINGRNNSSVSGIRNWGRRNGLYHKASSVDGIQNQMGSIKPGDVVIFTNKYNYQSNDGYIYRNNSVSHTGVVVAAGNGKVVIMEGNTNERKIDAQGNYITDKDGYIQPQSNVDGIMFKEYDANALFCRGYSGYIDMQRYQ